MRRESAVNAMNFYLVQRINDPKVGVLIENYRSEALYYCEQFDFNVEKAKEAFEADYKFEKSQKRWMGFWGFGSRTCF